MPLESWNLGAVCPALGTGMCAHHVDLNVWTIARIAYALPNAARSKLGSGKNPARNGKIEPALTFRLTRWNKWGTYAEEQT